MEITVAFLQEAFRKYNEEIFGNSLPIPNLRVSNAKRRLGSMHCRIQKTWGKTHRSFTIVVSNYYDVPLSLIEDTLIHEMIHYEIAYKKTERHIGTRHVVPPKNGRNKPQTPPQYYHKQANDRL